MQESPLCPSRRSFYRPELDVLRFFAFFGVFLFHFSDPVGPYVSLPFFCWRGIGALLLGAGRFIRLLALCITNLQNAFRLQRFFHGVYAATAVS
jgi:hypothetical protein